IHRDEEAELTATGSLAAYLALIPGQFDRVNSSYGGAETGFNIPAGQVNHVHQMAGTQRGWACAANSVGQYAVGLAHDMPNALPASNQARVTVSETNGSALLSLIFDWAAVGDNDAANTSSHTGNFIMAGGSGGCSRIASYHDWLLDRPAAIDAGANSALFTSGDSDDNNDGYYEGGGFWAIRSTAGDTLSFTVNTNTGNRLPPQRPAFRLHGLVLVAGDTPLVTVNGVAQVRGQDFLWQVEESGKKQEQIHWIYFGKSLVDGDTVQVSAPSN
ncbi:MAG: hypothetical protein JKY56_13680, partial [Kofleriaceae bacterium]|nr:hypothetical protein [Kofleriaceae bacterium]